MIQEQTASGSASSVWLLALLTAVVSLKRPGEVRLMLPASPRSRLTFSPQ